MAKNTTQAEVVVTLNGQAARNELNRIEKEMKQYRDAAEEAYRAGNKALGDQMTKNAQRLEKEFKVAKKEIKDFSDTVKNMGTKSIKELEAAAKGLEKQLKTLSRKDPSWEQKKKQYQQVTRQLKEMKAEYKGVAAQQASMSKSVAAGFTKAAAAIGVALAAIRRLGEAYKTITNYEQANANLASVLGATSKQMEELEKASIKLGSASRYTATQVTQLQTELAKLGFTVPQIIDMQKAVLNFAGSVGTDLASAAQLAGVALRAFDLRADQTEDALGTMAVACNKSALSFTYLQNSISTIAPVAKTYGLSLKDTVSLLGSLANAGFDASSAATATRNILLNLANANGKLSKALGGTVSSFDEIIDAMIKLREQGVDLNSTLEITDKRSVAAFNTFLDGAESARELRSALEDVNGELQVLADKRADTVEGAIDGMKSAWEGLVLSFRNSTGTFKEIFRDITDGINGIRAIIDPQSTVSEEGEAQLKATITDQYTNMLDPDKFGQYVEEQLAAYDAKIEQAGKKARRWGWAGALFAPFWGKWGDAKGVKAELEGERAVFEKTANEISETVELSLGQQLKQLSNIYTREMKAIEDDMTLSLDDVQRKQAELTERYNREQQEILKKDYQKREAQRNADTKDAEKNAKTKTEIDEKELKKRQLAAQQAFNRRKSQIVALHNFDEKQLKLAWLTGEIGEAEYNSELYAAKQKFYVDMLALAKQYGQSEADIVNQMLDDHIASLEREKHRIKDELDELERYNNTPIEGPGQTSTPSNIADEDAYESFMEEVYRKAADIRASILDDSARQTFETEMQWAQKLAEQEIITQEEAQQRIMQLKMDYARQTAQQLSSITSEAANFVNAIQDAELAALDADYQAQLTAAGNSAEERERIETNYQKKKLDIQKQYADMDMAINIAKAIAAGAVAVMQAFAQLGPIGGAVSAALIGATTAAEVAVIVAQRNAIKNSSVANTGVGSASSVGTLPESTDNIGARVTTGYSQGGPTRRSTSDATPAGIVHANEWVAPAWMVRSNPVTFANLEQYRRSGSHGRSGSASRGFADGGYTGDTDGSRIDSELIQVLQQVQQSNSRLSRQLEEGIRAYVALSEIEREQKMKNGFKKMTSL